MPCRPIKICILSLVSGLESFGYTLLVLVRVEGKRKIRGILIVNKWLQYMKNKKKITSQEAD